MDASGTHVVIVGGPEETEELLAMVLDDGEAIPLFESVDEAEAFLASIGDYGAGWRAREVSAKELLALLEYQGEEVEHVALSPPPERLEGGMEVEVLPLGALTNLLALQIPAEQPPSERKRSLWRRLFGR